ncbi:hypothetical protein K3728_05035 [Rhodobacteraceae bacterium M385]|nr:hypothetical protein K3728_05035 [Rhodobacteraceae bacterium M385]
MNDRPDIYLPSGGSISNLAAFSRSIQNAPKRETLHIGAGHVKFLRPTCMILLAKVCRTRGRKYKDETLTYHGLNKLGYANNMGFSEALSLDDNPFPQGAFGGESYIPLSVISLESLQSDMSENGGELGDAIERRSRDIALIVSQDRSTELRDILARSFREIFRNCFEHGDAQNAVFCAQYWKNLDTVEICIADRGIGVCKSLNQSKHTKPETDEEALAFSLMPGVSSKAYRQKKQKRANQHSSWNNSGYGLFFAHQLFGKLGHFYIASGESSLYLTREGYQTFPCSIEGTLVSMRMSLSNENEITGAITEIRNRAERVKARLGVKSLAYKSVQAFLSSGE